MLAKCERARDYLDWYEITRARDTSGLFDDYMRLKGRLENKPQRRDDHLAAYLDRLNKIFEREEPAGLVALPMPGPYGPDRRGEVLPDLPPNLPQHLPIDERPVNPPPVDVPIDLTKP